MKGKILVLNLFSFLLANGANAPKSVGDSCLRRRTGSGIWRRVEGKVSDKVTLQKNRLEEDESIDMTVKWSCGCIPVCTPIIRAKIE